MKTSKIRAVDLVTDAELGKWANELGYSSQKLTDKLGSHSSRQLQRASKELTGKTLQARLDEMRLQKALQLLKLGERTKEVAFKCGFKQLSHFSRMFKNRYGEKPSKFRPNTKASRSNVL